MRYRVRNLACIAFAGLLIIVCTAAKPTPATPAQQIDLPILMYHKVATNNPQKYVVTTTQLENDFQAIIAAGFTPVFIREVIDWVHGQGQLPAKPIVITFDDGQYNNLHYVLPLAQKYGVKYIINPVTAYSEKSIADQDTKNPRYSYLSWDDIKTGYDSGYVEYGNHTHDLHRQTPRCGVAMKPGESLSTYQEILKKDITQAQNLLTACGIPTPQFFAYPFGKYQASTRDILLNMGFQALLTCNEHVNIITQGDHTTLYNLGRFNRSGNFTTAQIIKKILE